MASAYLARRPRGRRIAVAVGILVVILPLSVLAAARLVAAATAGAPGSENDPLATKSYVDQYAQWQLVTLKAGQMLVAGAGTELILRAGSAKAVASASGGVADVTAGKDLSGGTALQANHLLIVPRADGRGAAAVSDAVFMVRGAFTVQ